MEKETIEMAAIRDHDGSVYYLPRPARHHNVIALMIEMGKKPPIANEQGFLTNNGDFVNRKKAKIIAIKALFDIIPETGRLFV